MTFHWTEKVNHTGEFIMPTGGCFNWREGGERREREGERGRKGEREKERS